MCAVGLWLLLYNTTRTVPWVRFGFLLHSASHTFSSSGPAECFVSKGEVPPESVEMPVCGSLPAGAGIEAYKAYCWEHFASVRHSVAQQQAVFNTSFLEYGMLGQDLATNTTLPSTGVQALEVALERLEMDYIRQEIIPNQCWEGCAYFIGQACCEDPVPRPACTSAQLPPTGGKGFSGTVPYSAGSVPYCHIVENYYEY